MIGMADGPQYYKKMSVLRHIRIMPGEGVPYGIETSLLYLLYVVIK